MGERSGDRIGKYRGWVRIVNPSPNYEIPKPFGSIEDTGSREGEYIIALAAPAIEIATGEKTLLISEAAANLRRIRYDNKILEELIKQRGIEPDEYSFFFCSDEGERFLSRPGYYVENASGSLVTNRGKHYSWWMDWDEEAKRIALTDWEEIVPQEDWCKDSEYTRACAKMALKSPMVS